LGAERLRPGAKEVVVWDENLPGFGMRVSPRGRKAFIVQYRVRGARGTAWKERQVTLGTLAFMTVAEARKRARLYKSKASEGVDPAQELRAAEQVEETQRQADAFTFGKLVERYTNEYLVRRKPSGIAERTRLLKRWLPRLGDKPVSEIGEADILTFINEILSGRSNGRAEADHLVGVVRHMFTWARKGQNDTVLKSLVTVNPAAGIARWSEPNARDRVLSHDEIKRFWAACDTVAWPGGRILQLLLLSGQRVNEVARLRWSELDLANKVWNLPAARSKNGKAHTIHLNDLAMEIIQSLPQIDNSSFVFTIDGARPFTNTNPLRDRVHHLMGEETPYFQLRDLRRSAATLMAELRIAPHVVDKVLNHSGGEIQGVAAIYNRFQYLDERKLALEALGRKVAQLIGRDPDNVVVLRA
jgi:integrase